ncbi:trigger factor [Striga asiatica]|uniref:Trigger factor n=1 Tax=Striga asiatica TaxID=4170 RepID=A0A5A7QA06_STRAF|nr:trigger factor [Striga asiatica]
MAASARGVVGDCGGTGERQRVAATVPAERQDDRCNGLSMAVSRLWRFPTLDGGIPQKRPPLLIDRRERTVGGPLLLKVADEDFSTGSSAVLFANGRGRPLLVDSWV